MQVYLHILVLNKCTQCACNCTWVNISEIATGWRPVVAVFCNNPFLITEIIVLSDLIFWLNKLGVTVGIILNYFFKLTIVCACDRSLSWFTKKHKLMKAAYQWWPLLLP